MEYQFEAIGPALRWVVLVFLMLFALVAVAVLVGIAGLPGWVARKRKHPQAAAINVCGWFGLPTGVLWVFAMVWAYWKPDQHRRSAAPELSSELIQLKTDLTKLEAALNRLEDAS